MSTLPSALFQKWMRSQEEERSSSKQIYRPENFPFPRARGRSGFKIEANGNFLYIGIAPEDGRLLMIGRWYESGRNLLSVELESGIRLTIKLLRVEPSLLIIKTIEASD